MKKVLVACGTGVATSTVVTIKIKEAIQAAGIQADVHQCKVSEIDSNNNDVDLIVTTTAYEHPVVPVIRSLSFLTGIGMDADVEKIINILKA